MTLRDRTLFWTGVGGATTTRGDTMELRSTITCPVCAHRQTETMPTDACQFFYDCKGCGMLLRPQPGDCCVFCSFGSVPCPPVQEVRRAGASVETCCYSQPRFLK